MPSDFSPQILPLGATGVLLRFGLTATPGAMAAARTFVARLNVGDLPGVTEIAPSLTSVLVTFDPTITDRLTVENALKTKLAVAELENTGMSAQKAQRLWRIPVAFGGENGPQLAEAAKLAGISEETAIATLCDPVEVLTIGFAPGQPYAGLLPENWDLPRQAAVNPMVPAGAVITAVRQLILFNQAGPTGWRHIGRTAFRPFYANRQKPILLRPADQLQLQPVSGDHMRDLLANNADGLGGARCEVLA